jgi:hypothetical protein
LDGNNESIQKQNTNHTEKKLKHWLVLSIDRRRRNGNKDRARFRNDTLIVIGVMDKHKHSIINPNNLDNKIIPKKVRSSIPESISNSFRDSLFLVIPNQTKNLR